MEDPGSPRLKICEHFSQMKEPPKWKTPKLRNGRNGRPGGMEDPKSSQTSTGPHGGQVYGIFVCLLWIRYREHPSWGFPQPCATNCAMAHDRPHPTDRVTGAPQVCHGPHQGLCHGFMSHY